MNLFKIATRNKFRFESSIGQLTVEDLWDLPLTSDDGPSLDIVATDINSELQQKQQTSFVPSETRDPNVDILANKLDLVKLIIGQKVDERRALHDATKKRKTKQQLLEILERKQTAALEDLSEEELREKIESL